MLVLCVFSSVLSVFCVCFVVCPRSGGALIFLLATASREAVLCVVRLCVFSVFLCRAMVRVIYVSFLGSGAGRQKKKSVTSSMLPVQCFPAFVV